MDSRIDTYKHIQTVQKFLGRCITDLLRRQQGHDQSKLVSPEVEVFDEFTPKLAAVSYGSEEYRGFLAAMQPALDHHYAANDHHPEHYPRPAGPTIDRLQASRDELVAQPQDELVAPPQSGRALIDAVACMDADLASRRSPVRQMTLPAILEMLCDWAAAARRHNDGDVRKSIEINQRRFGYSDELKQILLNTLEVIERNES